MAGLPIDDDDDPSDQEQDLAVVLKLSNRRMGTHDERQQLEQFADELGEAVAAAGVGEFDGDEYGGGDYTMFFCGPDAEALWRVLQPLLKRSPLCRGGHVLRMQPGPDGELVPQRQPI